MKDLKLCLLNLIRPDHTDYKKAKLKSSQNISDPYHDDFMQKYKDLAIIYFNDNLTMAKKNDMRNFLPKNSINFRPSMNFRNIFDSENSDTYCNSGCAYTDSENDGCVTSDWEVTNQDLMDSVCTLCTSSFSYNNGSCLYCSTYNLKWQDPDGTRKINDDHCKS